jgi:hypothetical protein
LLAIIVEHHAETALEGGMVAFVEAGIDLIFGGMAEPFVRINSV